MSKIIINKQSYYHNLKYLASKTGGAEKIMAVIKDNAYGHGIEIMAKLASDFGIKKAAVKNLEEALKVKDFFDEVLILADHPPKLLCEENISFAVHSMEFLKEFPSCSNIHLNIDTGMHRNGILMEEIGEAIKYIKENSLILKGIFTHFRSADDLNSELFWQQENYKKVKKISQEFIKKYGLIMPSFHSCNSAALLRNQEEFDDDFARCGIATYGYTHVDKNIDSYDLKPVMSLYAKRLSSRILKKGQRVGYGGIHQSCEDKIISTYDIGYGDGFFRYDGLGDLRIANSKKILGRVSMDSLCIASKEDEICIFEDVTDLATYFNTITYEILCKLSSFIQKEVI